MAVARKAVPTDRAATDLAADVAELVRSLKALADPYRPEQHYMRGPGPKWHAKHNPAPTTLNTGFLTLVRVER